VERVSEKMRSLDKVHLLFSGGVDSTALLILLLEEGVEVESITFDSDIIPRRTVERAKIIADELGVMHRIMHLGVSDKVIENGKHRCYYCKKSVLENVEAGRVIIDGTSITDAREYRPGIRALEEFGVISPFRECGVGKREIYEFIKNYKLPYLYNESCLATRFIGIPVDLKMGKFIDSVEDALIKEFDLLMVRLRFNGKDFQLELLPQDSHKAGAVIACLEPMDTGKVCFKVYREFF